MLASPIQIVGGDPEPSQEATRRLREAFSDRFFLRWNRTVRKFEVNCRWAPEDSRRADVQSGEEREDRAHDLLAFLPPDCPVEQAESYLTRMLQANPVRDYKAMAARRLAHNATAVTPAEQAWLDEFSNQAEVLVGHRGAKAVYMSDTEARSTRVSKPVEP